MDPKRADPVCVPHDRFMKSADTSNDRTHSDRRQERQRVTKDWRDLAELLQQSAN